MKYIGTIPITIIMSLEDWLHSHVEWRGGYIKRGQLFKDFLHDGLLPFIDSMGYVVGTAPKFLYGYIVAGLYENSEKTTMESKWNTTYFTKDWIREDRIHYSDAIDSDTWDSFWSSWNDIEEFSEYSFRGYDRRIDIEWLVWRQLDLQNSYQTDVLYDRMNDEYEVETEETPSKKVDVYLTETAGWGGQRR